MGLTSSNPDTEPFGSATPDKNIPAHPRFLSHRSLNAPQPWPNLLFPLTVCAIAGIIALYFIPVMEFPFIYDENTIVHWADSSSPPYLGAFRPSEGGTWRPVPVLLTRVLFDTFGLHPAMFRSCMATLHLLNTLLVAYVALRATGSRRAATAAALLAALHPAAMLSASRFDNCADILITTFSLLAMLLVLSSPRENDICGGAAVAALLALACKETALVLAPVLAVLSLQLLPPARIRPGRNLLLLTLVYAAAALWGLTRATAWRPQSASYLIAPGPHFFRQMLDYALSLPCPGIHLTPAGALSHLSHTSLWALRILTLFILAVIGSLLWRTRRQLELGFFAAMLLFVSIPSLITSVPEVRFAYVSVFCWALFLSLTLTKLPRPYAAAIVLFVILMQLPFLFSNDQRRRHLTHGKNMLHITTQLRKYSARIPHGYDVAIRNHPYGKSAQVYPYGYYWLNVYFPEKNWTFRLNNSADTRAPHEAVFTWTGTALVPERLPSVPNLQTSH